jgi:hypothetical protein
MTPVKPRSNPVTCAAVAILTIGASCLGSLTAEASRDRKVTVEKTAAPDTAMRRPPSTTAGRFFMVVAFS